MKYLRRVGGLLVLGLLAAACSVGTTAPDQVAVHYHGGLAQATKFADCQGPSTRKTTSPGDKWFMYPTGQRTYDFSGGQGAESGPIPVVSADNQELTVSGILTFNMDTNCQTLRRFHEQIGLKYQAYMNGNTGDTPPAGWDELLRAYMGQPLRKALATAAQKYNWLDLYNDPATRVKFETEVRDVLPQGVRATTGGTDYFINFSLTLQKPEPNAALVQALTAAQVAVTNKQAVINQNATVQAELQQIKSLTDILGPYGYILYKALQDCSGGGQRACPAFLPVPQGTNLQVPTNR